MTRKTQLTQLELPGMPQSQTKLSLESEREELALRLIGVVAMLTSYERQLLTLLNMDMQHLSGTLVSKVAIQSELSVLMELILTISGQLKTLIFISKDWRKILSDDATMREMISVVEQLELLSAEE